MTSKLSPAEFRTLQQQWYKKLEEDGFKDIEQEDGRLRSWASWFQTHYTAEGYALKENYYYLATNFLGEYTFPSDFYRRIWGLHCEGYSTRRITNWFRARGEYCQKDKANQIINFLRQEMLKKHKGKCSEAVIIQLELKLTDGKKRTHTHKRIQTG